MFQLDDQVGTWREGLEDLGWFAPHELDELEDHLRSHAALKPQSGSAPISARAWEDVVREELGEPAALFREFARSETPLWRPLLLAAWGLYGLSFFLSGFGTVGFAPSHPNFGMSYSGHEFLHLALAGGWVLAVIPNLAMVVSLPAVGRARRSIEAWLMLLLGATGASTLGLGVVNLLRPLPISVDGDLVIHAHLGPAYWVWSASFAMAATALWLREREWSLARLTKPAV